MDYHFRSTQHCRNCEFEFGCQYNITEMSLLDYCRFRVKTEMIRPEKLDAGTTMKGLDYIDVPGNSKRDYKLTFNAHKEGISQIKVHLIYLIMD